ncbi:LysR substrate-binding domain-containing protein [Neomesorhizobium albiziae]|uniref:LysR substrate-binding domain-containing protein n=1 Tax=Neomesorhizobium albiziae TaxID=335020 RepID=UPI0024535A0D|nr:LysR substrate-binding domain-containing protein [Mesorhizobium albiziae]
MTALGQGLLPDVVQALEDLERALERARRSVGNPKLRISTTPEFSAQWLAPRLIDFCNNHPDIDVSVTVQYRRAGLADEDIDVAIRLSGVAEDGTEQLTTDEEFAVCAPEIFRILPERDAMLVAPLLRYDGARHTMLDWRRWHAELYGDRGDARDAIDFDGGPSYRTFTEMLDACRQGLGFALVRSSLVADDLLAGRLMRCFTESVVSDLQYRLATAPGRREQPGVLAFRRWIFDHARGRDPV